MDHSEESVRALLKRQLEPHGWRVGGPIAAENSSGGGASSTREVDVLCIRPDGSAVAIEVKPGRLASDGDTWTHNKQFMQKPPHIQAEDAARSLERLIADRKMVPGATVPVEWALAAPSNSASEFPLHIDRERILDGATLTAAAEGRKALLPIIVAISDRGDHRARIPNTVDIASTLGEQLFRKLAGRPSSKAMREMDLQELGRFEVAIDVLLGALRDAPRIQVIGAAGSGKSYAALRKVQELAQEGRKVLYLCFNQRLAAVNRAAVAELGITVETNTFHRFAELAAIEAGIPIPSRPQKQEELNAYFGLFAPALEQAIKKNSDLRFDALVIDEGQDFEPAWIELLGTLLKKPDDPWWVFHDPAQAFTAPWQPDRLQFQPFRLRHNLRNPRKIHAWAEAQRLDGLTSIPVRTSEGSVEEITLHPSGQTATLRNLLRRLTEEGVKSWEIAVLTGGSVKNSQVWREMRRDPEFPLWNDSFNEFGEHTGKAADELQEIPSDIYLFESIRRFKGLESPYIIALDLPERDAAVHRYVAGTRATAGLTIVRPALEKSEKS